MSIFVKLALFLSVTYILQILIIAILDVFTDVRQYHSTFSLLVRYLIILGFVVYIIDGYAKNAFNFAIHWQSADNEFRDRNKVFQKREASMLSSLIHMPLMFVMVLICFFSLEGSYYTTIQGDSGTAINVYGIGKAVINDDSGNITLWDAVDIAVPAEENVVSFITTKRMTIHQTLGNCSESRRIQEAHCTSDENCTADAVYKTGHGIATGNCLNDVKCLLGVRLSL